MSSSKYARIAVRSSRIVRRAMLARSHMTEMGSEVSLTSYTPKWTEKV